MNLIVALPFGPYGRGQCISDPQEIELVLLGENAGKVRRVPAEAEAEPEAPAAETDAAADQSVDPAAA